jgi:hypothetical protein
MAYLNPETRGSFAENEYWSSSEDGSKYAWYQTFYDGYQSGSDKGSTLPVRAVRGIKVEELLAQPEQEPLGFKMVEDFLELYEEVSYDYRQGFNDAVLWAEKQHGIGERNSHYKERYETFGEDE